MKLRLLLSLALRRELGDNASLRRYGTIVRGGATAVVAKLVAMGAALVSVPLTLHHLGAERYGLWATLFSILAWLSLADLGLTNGLMNALSQAFAQQRRDLAREYVSSAFWGLTGIALLVAVLVTVCHQLLDWRALLHIGSQSVSDEFALAVSVAALVFVINLPFTIVNRVLTAAQRPEIANFWAIGSSAASVAALTAAVWAGAGLPVLVFAFSGTQMLVNVASAIWLFARAYPDLKPTTQVAATSLRKVFGVAGAFFVTQIATLMIFQSGNFIVAHNLGPQSVPPYQVTWLVTLYVLIPHQLISSSLWATIGEAFALDDIAWIRHLVQRYAIAGFVVCGPLIVLMVLFGDRAIELWAGAAARPSRELLSWMAAWAVVQVLMQPLMAVLGGTGRLREYSMFSVVAAAASMGGGVVMVTHYGSVGVIASTVVSFTCLALVPAVYLVAKTLRRPMPGVLAHQ